MPDASGPPAARTPPALTHVSRAAEARFETGLRAFFAYRDLGVAKATAGAFGAQVIRAVPGAHATGEWHAHELGFQLFYVLRGWVRFEYGDIGEHRFEAGDCVYQPPGVPHREIAHSDDLELLEITAPGDFATRSVDAVASRG